MPYCKEFNDLFSYSNFEEVLIHNPISNVLGTTHAEIARQIKLQDCKSISKWLDEIYKQYKAKKSRIQPLHIGLGNPDSNILIVGHELAINADKPSPKKLENKNCTMNNYYAKLLINEAVLNYSLWSSKVNGGSIAPSCCLQDPEFPPSFCHLYNTEKPGGHYWSKINNIISNLHNKTFDFNTDKNNASFFSHVFLTELNSIPSAKSQGIQDRSSLKNKFDLVLSNPFYSKFGRVIFSCRTYLNKHVPGYMEDIKRVHAMKESKTFQATRNIKAVFKSGTKKVIVCSNLSGVAGWSSDELKVMAELLK